MRLQKSRYKRIGFIFLIVSLWIISSNGVTGKESLTLFTPQEAEKLKLTDEEWGKKKRLLRAGPRQDGPVIELKSPSLTDASVEPPSIETAPPVDLIVIFKENSAPVNMESLEVIGKKGIFSTSLTKRLKPYIKGTTLEALGVKIPEGKFRIEVSIADINGKKTAKSYRLWIKNPT